MIGRKLDSCFLLDRYMCYLRVHTAQENQTIVTVYKMQHVDSVLYVTKLNHKIINSRLLPLAEDVVMSRFCATPHPPLAPQGPPPQAPARLAAPDPTLPPQVQYLRVGKGSFSLCASYLARGSISRQWHAHCTLNSIAPLLNPLFSAGASSSTFCASCSPGSYSTFPGQWCGETATVRRVLGRGRDHY